MTRRLGVVMDSISAISPQNDSTVAMLLDATRRGWAIDYMELGDLRLRSGRAEATARPLQVRDQHHDWYTLGSARDVELSDLDVVLMRKDPPVDLEYITATWILEAAERDGTLVSNRPQALRDANEKLAATWFPEVTPPSLVSRDRTSLRAFIEAEGRTVLKPLDLMGGRRVVATGPDDPNAMTLLDDLTHQGTRTIIAQRYLPAVTETGDKRILMVNGEPVSTALARTPAPGDFRANLAAGGTASPSDLTARERDICREIGPMLRERGLHFVGIDVIDGWLTEINVTSPTGIRQVDRFFGTNVSGQLLDALERLLVTSERREVRSPVTSEA
jgi:glutathione synthase